ncbi:hypothetical protein Tco_0908541 [Tanacetum coccineum]|uniref:Reverse transcriptase domain-containing protein n=1 Tax=Tanacetum coccineum TaxID=301880 RepID=A0ABQ5CMH1_9ASTR
MNMHDHHRGKDNQRGLPILLAIIEEETTMHDGIWRMLKMTQAWGLSMDASDYAHSDVMSLRTTVVAQSALISERDYNTDGRGFRGSKWTPAKGPRHCLMQPGEASTVPRFDYVIAMQCQPKMAPKRRTTRLNPNATTNITSPDTHTLHLSLKAPNFMAMIDEVVNTGFKALAHELSDSLMVSTKMESVYSISNYTVACQVKFATCTLQGNALTWWNSHVKTTTPEAAHAMPWRTLKKMMTDSLSSSFFSVSRQLARASS